MKSPRVGVRSIALFTTHAKNCRDASNHLKNPYMSRNMLTTSAGSENGMIITRCDSRQCIAHGLTESYRMHARNLVRYIYFTEDQC